MYKTDQNTTKFARCFEGYLEFSAVFRNVYFFFTISPVETLTLFCGTLVGKRCRGVYTTGFNVRKFLCSANRAYLFLRNLNL